jgi:WD40 repeat protein
MAVIPTYENTLVLIDLKTLEEKRRINVSYGIARETVFSPDGKMLAVKIERGLITSMGGIPAVQVWEVETGKELLTLDRRSHPIFLRDGRTLLTRQGENIFEDGMKLELWDIKTGRQLEAMKVLPNSRNCGGPIPVPGTDLVAIYGSQETKPNWVIVDWLKRFFHAGASGSSEEWNEIKLLNLTNGREELSFVQEGPWIYDFKIPPNGKWLATRAQTYKDFVITVWDIPPHRPGTWIIWALVTIPFVVTVVVICRGARPSSKVSSTSKTSYL